jgi:hypothetical protein
VSGAAQARDATLATASAEMKWLNGFSLAGTFEGEFSSVTRCYAARSGHTSAIDLRNAARAIG